MSILGFRSMLSCMISCAINLGLVAWGLFLLGQGWNLPQTGGDLTRDGAATLLAGGLFLFLVGVAGIVHAMIGLRLLAKSNRHQLAPAPSVDTTV